MTEEQLTKFEALIEDLVKALPELLRYARIGYDNEILSAEIQAQYEEGELH